MQWPPDITAAFAKAIDVEPVEGVTKDEIIQHLLDETARRAVWRARADPSQLEAAYRTPYTPLGSFTVELTRIKTKSITIKPPWNDAVDRLYAFVGKSAALVCEQFRGEEVAYCDEA